MRIVGGKYKGKKLPSPKSRETRPTSDRARETLFNILFHNPALKSFSLEDKTVLDVFAGTGALGFEALSRGAKSATFIEKDPQALKALKATLQDFSLPFSWLIAADATQIHQAPHGFDFVFLDPPYDQGLVSPTLYQLLDKGWLASNGLVVIEISKKEQPSLPSFLTLLLERTEGAAQFLFCQVNLPQ